MMRYGLRAWGIACVTVVASAAWLSTAWGVPLDKDGDIKLGVRTYVNARIQTEHTDRNVVYAPTDPGRPISNDNNLPLKVQEAQTFPYSPPGHLRQNRFYVEAELDHNLTRLMKSFGPLPLLRELPFKIDDLKYHLTYRGEGEGVYNWGPQEFSSSNSYRALLQSAGATWINVNGPADGSNVQPNYNPPNTCTLSTCPNVPAARQRLRHTATVRNRLFQAYIDMTIGDLFLRTGRQILVWGETDAFRLLDNINPTDNSFGGFLISLDERRVPIDMLRASYRLGEYGDLISEAQVEGYFSPDNDVAYYPGNAPGSPWTLPNLGAPNGTTYTFAQRPPYSFQSGRGGGRLVFNAFDATFSIAHYYTWAERPLLQFCVAPNFPLQRVTNAAPPPAGIGDQGIAGCRQGPTNLPVSQPPGANPSNFAILAPQALAVQSPAKIQLSGLTTTFNIPSTISRSLGLSGEPVVRSELAYIKDEPYYRQSTSDPFVFHFNGDFLQVSGDESRDSINYVLGLDTNQFIRFLNPVNSFFISTQFFYKHIKNAAVDGVLPVPARNVAPSNNRQLGAVQPDFINEPINQYLQTLLISTAYMSGQVNPSLTLFYDWGGAVAVIPSVTLVRDPFRFTMQYNYLEAGHLFGASGTSLLRDRDNVLFQFEYVI